MILPGGASQREDSFGSARLCPWRRAGIPLELTGARDKPASGETTTDLKPRRFLLVALLAAGTATFVLAALRRRREDLAPVPYARPEGGEREGEFELFIGS
jgi:hypothetical protein